MELIEWGGKRERVHLTPCGFYHNDKFRGLSGHVLVVWPGSGTRSVALVPTDELVKPDAPTWRQRGPLPAGVQQSLSR